MKMARDYILNGATGLSVSTTPTAAVCIQKCIATASCESINFNTTSSECSLLSDTYGDAGVTLTCSEDNIFVALDWDSMPSYIKSKDMACQFLSDACPNIYENCVTTCSSDRWVGSCASPLYLDCKDAYAKGERRSGIYEINPDGGTPFEVYCKMNNDTVTGTPPGVTLIVRRKDGSVNFNVDSTAIQSLVGDLDGEFFIGGDNLARLTASAKEATVILYPWEPDYNVAWAHYSTFQVAPWSDRYRMTATGHHDSNTGNVLYYLNGDQLRTPDYDVGNCATTYGPIWTSSGPCHYFHPFGTYYYGFNSYSAKGLVYYTHVSYYYSYRAMEWMIY